MVQAKYLFVTFCRNGIQRLLMDEFWTSNLSHIAVFFLIDDPNHAIRDALTGDQ